MIPRRRLDDLADFVAVARARSFTRAAASLRVSTSALSHSIRGLESRLGVRLLQRTSRSVSVTEAGARLLATLEPALASIEAALHDADRERHTISGTVRITATRHAYETVLRPVLPAFLAAHPHANVEVSIDYQFRDIVADGFDAGIRIGEKLQQDMIATRVGPDLRMVVVAAPAYLATTSAPTSPAALTTHRCINLRLIATGQTYAWEFTRGSEAMTIKVDGPLTFNDPAPILDAALDGHGVAYVLHDQAAPHLATGRLVALLEDWGLRFPGYFFYYASRRQVAPALSAFIEAMRRSADVGRSST